MQDPVHSALLRLHQTLYLPFQQADLRGSDLRLLLDELQRLPRPAGVLPHPDVDLIVMDLRVQLERPIGSGSVRRPQIRRVVEEWIWWMHLEDWCHHLPGCGRWLPTHRVTPHPPPGRSRQIQE